jgi:hypothetical protein
MKNRYQKLRKPTLMKRIALIGSFVFNLLSCKPSDPNFDFKSLDALKYERGDIREGTKIRILSFSGGPECTGKTSYYYQFIGINKETNDTVRILSPCQTIPEGNTPTEGTFSSWEKNSATLDQALDALKTDHDELKDLDKKDFDFEGTNRKVVFNKKQLDIETRNYKTVIGSLGF